jgi:hypothetical protein
MASAVWKRVSRWLIALLVCAISFFFVFLWIALAPLLEYWSARFLDAIRFEPIGSALDLIGVAIFGGLLALWVGPSCYSIGFALGSRPISRIQCATVPWLGLIGLFIWHQYPAGPVYLPYVAVLVACTAFVTGTLWSFRGKRRSASALAATFVCLVALAIPFWVAFARANPDPPTAQRLWSVYLKNQDLAGMNSESEYTSQRQVIVVGDRVVAVYDTGVGWYEGKIPMSKYRLVSIDIKTGEIKKSLDFVGRWGYMPYIYANAEPAGFFVTGLVPPSNPILTGHLIDAHLLAPMAGQFKLSGQAVAASSPTKRGTLRTDILWKKEYPKDDAFVTLTDEAGIHLLFHGACSGEARFLSDDRVLLAGCQTLRIIDRQGGIVRQAAGPDGYTRIAGISGNGDRFALVSSKSEGDPQHVLYEHFIIYRSDDIRPIAVIRTEVLPQFQSWSAFSVDGRYFVSGGPDALGLYLLPQ